MSQLYSMSLSATKYLCGLIRDLASVSEGIDDINLRSDGTFSSVMIDTLIKKCLQDSNEYTEKLVANLSRLELKLVTSESEITQPNILYLFKPDGATSYNQYVVIEGNKVLLGTCDIDMAQYLKIADASKTYATKTELKAVTDKIGTTALTTTAQTLTGSIEEVKGIAEQGALLTVTKEQYQQLVAGQTVAIGGKDYTYDSNTYYVVKDDADSIITTSTINSSSTDSEVPTAKAVYNNCIQGRNITDDIISTYGSEMVKYPLGKWYITSFQQAQKISDIPLIDGVKNAGFLEIFSINPKVSPFTGVWGNILCQYTYYTGETFTRRIGSGSEAGVITSDTGWQRVVTTKVDDVPETNITWKDDTLRTDFKASYEVKNGVCYVYFDTVKMALTEGKYGHLVAEGLPKVKENRYVNFMSWAMSGAVLFRITTSGQLLLWAAVENNGVALHGSFSYPVAES